MLEILDADQVEKLVDILDYDGKGGKIDCETLRARAAFEALLCLRARACFACSPLSVVPHHVIHPQTVSSAASSSSSIERRSCI